MFDRFRLVILLALASTLTATTAARAQITPPAPGVEIPRIYRERMARDKTAFQFRRAWFRETERVRKNREAVALMEAQGLSSGAQALDVAVSGIRRVPVLAGKFSNTGADPYTPAQLETQLFDGPNPTGTIPQFYDEISYGAIQLQGTVYGTAGGGLIPAAHPDTYYEGNPGDNGLGGAARTGEYLKELLDARDGTVDFSQFDNDGPDGVANSGDDDGYVDFVAFVHPETGGECGTTNLWSHRWVYEGWTNGVPYTTNDPAAGGGFIKVSDYTIQPLKSCGGLGIIEIGVYAHEFGHAFGLPDLYDTDGTSNGIGQWCLMASGSYGGDGNHPETPVHMSAWCKEQLGWVNPVIVCADEHVSLPAVATTPTVLKVYPHGIAGPEYFLIENRVKTGHDLWLPVSGIAVFHVDNSQAGNANEARKLVDLEEADGAAHLDLKVNRADTGDLFPGSTNNQLFDDTTNPDARDYANAATGFSLSGFDAAANPRGFDVTVTSCRLRTADIAVDDLPLGNNNHVLDGFETANLRLGLLDDFAGSVTGVSATLTSITPGVEVTQGAVSYGTVAGTVNYGSGEFTVRATGALPDGSHVKFLLTLTGNGGYSSVDTVEIRAGRFVLVVEDDGAAVHGGYFLDAITGAGYATVHLDATTFGLPSLGLMKSAVAVVWYTGEAYDNTLSPLEQELLTAYLQDDGRLFLTGQDIGYDLEAEGTIADRTFYANVLHADFIADDSQDQTLDGVAGDPIGNGLTASLSGVGGANNSTYPSVIASLNGAADVFRYSPAATAGLRYQGAYRLVYFAFNFESIASSPGRTTIMQRILAWLSPADTTPPTATLTSPVGSEVLDACGTQAVTWTAGDNVAVTGVDLYYSNDGGQTYPFTLATGLPNTGSYDWSPGGIEGAAFRMKLVARDAMALQAVSLSPADFTITDPDTPAVAVLAPHGGQIFDTSAAIPIRWSPSVSCVGLDSSQVFMSFDGGGGWNLIATVPAPDTSFIWTAPDSVVDSILVWVEIWVGDNAGFDLSNGYFEVTGSGGALGLPDGMTGVTRPVLLQNFPNPLRGSASTFAFYLPAEERVTLTLFDLAGRRVRVLADGRSPAGYHEVHWDGADDLGRTVGHGVYFYTLETPEGRQVRKLVKIR